MNKPQSENPRARLQQLLAIPDRQRTDEEWDELNELEIMLAVGNREVIPGQNQRREGQPPGGGGQNRPNRGPDGKQPQRKMHNRPPKRKGPPR